MQNSSSKSEKKIGKYPTTVGGLDLSEFISSVSNFQTVLNPKLEDNPSVARAFNLPNLLSKLDNHTINPSDNPLSVLVDKFSGVGMDIFGLISSIINLVTTIETKKKEDP